MHGLRVVAGKDGNPLNEVELLSDSLMNNRGALRGGLRASLLGVLRRARAQGFCSPTHLAARLGGVDFGCAWLTLEPCWVHGLCAADDAAVAADACARAPRRWCSCASLRG